MSEARRDSTSSLQRKKPPWLKLDIPVVAPPVAEEPSFVQVGAGRWGLGACPLQPPHHDPLVQPLRRQAFLRSVSMPAEAARVPSPPHEARRPVLQRQTSITQTIRRYCAASAVRPQGGWRTGGQGSHPGPPLDTRPGSGAGAFLSWPSPQCCSSCHLVLLPLWGPAALTSFLLCSPPALTLSFSVSPLPMRWALNSRQVRFGRVHTLPLLGPPGARRALPQRRSLSRSLLRYLAQGVSVLTSAGVCMAVAGAVAVPWGS